MNPTPNEPQMTSEEPFYDGDNQPHQDFNYWKANCISLRNCHTESLVELADLRAKLDSAYSHGYNPIAAQQIMELQTKLTASEAALDEAWRAHIQNFNEYKDEIAHSESLRVEALKILEKADLTKITDKLSWANVISEARVKLDGVKTEKEFWKDKPAIIYSDLRGNEFKEKALSTTPSSIGRRLEAADLLEKELKQILVYLNTEKPGNSYRLMNINGVECCLAIYQKAKEDV